jgi:signal transduction histidine kinase
MNSELRAPMTLAVILVAHRHDMLRLWMQAVRREAPETQGLSDADLTGNFPLLFDRPIRGLEGEPPPPTMPESRAHAATRKRQGIGLPTLLREYTLLQHTIRTFAAEMLGARPGDTESRTIDAILFRAVEEAVLTYTATKEAELALAKGRSDHLIAALAHDIRSPLNAMALTLTLMEMKLGDRLDAEDREDMASMRAGITAVLDLHRGILEQSRLAAGRVVAEPTAFRLDVALGDFVRVVQSMATYKGIAMVKDLAAGATVRADRAMLQQVVGNLLSNAIRYTVRGSITVRSRLEAGGVRVEVEDTGIGMTPEDQARIFEEFFQVDGTHRSFGEGYGLGLAVAKRMAALMGGDLSVTSEPGKGSRFTLSLPPSVLEGSSGSL